MNHEDSIRDDLFADPEEVVTFAQAYYATELPNEERRDCPSANALRIAARAAILPDEGLRAHLFSCSECFRLYRGARMNHRSQPADGSSLWVRLGSSLAHFGMRPVPIAIGALCLCLLGVINAALWWHVREEAPTMAANHSRQQSLPRDTVPTVPAPTEESSAVPGPPALEPGRAPFTQNVQVGRPKAGIRNQRAQPTLRVVEISLRGDDLLRGDEETGGKQRVITLVPERLRLRLHMPRGSAAGRYTVKIVDAFGKPLVTKAADSNGKILAVDLDLRGLTAKKYRLCVARDGEAPDCYLVSLNDQPLRAVKR